jgi:hypothetical protein
MGDDQMRDLDTRLFSIAEVNELIPRLELIMERLQFRAVELRDSLQDLADETGRPASDLEVAHLLQRWPDKRELLEDLQNLVAQIDDCGGQFKGLDLGLVDFPAEIDGEIALLCWQYGEKEVHHWHPLESGFSGRKPLPAEREVYLQ